MLFEPCFYVGLPGAIFTSAVYGAATINVIDGKEFKSGFATTDALAAIGIKRTFSAPLLEQDQMSKTGLTMCPFVFKRATAPATQSTRASVGLPLSLFGAKIGKAFGAGMTVSGFRFAATFAAAFGAITFGSGHGKPPGGVRYHSVDLPSRNYEVSS